MTSYLSNGFTLLTLYRIGALLTLPTHTGPEMLLAEFDVRAIREARADAAGRAMLEPVLAPGAAEAGRLKLCELHKHPAFAR